MNLMHNPGEKRYLALVNEIVLVTVIEEGLGRHTFPRGKMPKNPYVVRVDRPARCGLGAGDEFVVASNALHANPIDANVEASRMANELGDGYDDDEDDDDDEDLGEEDEDADDED